jgi:hypothetical protein
LCKFMALVQALNCILRCGPKAGAIGIGRPKKLKREHVERAVRLLEAGLETDADATRATAPPAAPQQQCGVEIIDADGCCVLCGGCGADLLCTFPCPSTFSQADADGAVPVCGCM